MDKNNTSGQYFIVRIIGVFMTPEDKLSLIKFVNLQGINICDNCLHIMPENNHICCFRYFEIRSISDTIRELLERMIEGTKYYLCETPECKRLTADINKCISCEEIISVLCEQHDKSFKTNKCEECSGELVFMIDDICM